MPDFKTLPGVISKWIVTIVVKPICNSTLAVISEWAWTNSPTYFLSVIRNYFIFALNLIKLSINNDWWMLIVWYINLNHCALGLAKMWATCKIRQSSWKSKKWAIYQTRMLNLLTKEKNWNHHQKNLPIWTSQTCNQRKKQIFPKTPSN